jgi:hypothetical protein
LWEKINRLIQIALSPKLYRIEKEVDEMLEWLVEDSSTERITAVTQLFQKLGLENYAFYERTSICDFTLLTSQGPIKASTFQVSKYLRDFLSTHQAFIDMVEAPFEWETFFHQFELHRLQNASGYRYPTAGYGRVESKSTQNCLPKSCHSLNLGMENFAGTVNGRLSPFCSPSVPRIWLRPNGRF